VIFSSIDCFIRGIGKAPSAMCLSDTTMFSMPIADY
jgi:hypothetical protein